MNEEIKKALDDFGTVIDGKLKAVTEKLALMSSDTEKKHLMEAIKKELEPEIAKYNKMQENLDALEAKLKRVDFGGSLPGKTFSVELKETLENIIKKEGARTLRGRMLNFEEKTVLDMTEGNAFNSTVVVPPAYQPGVVYDPSRPMRIRDLISQGPTDSNLVRFIREYSYTDAAAVTSEGAEYKQEDFTLKTIDAAVQKITNYIVLSEEMLEDVNGLTSYIMARLPEKLRNAEDSFILSNGTYGILTLGTAYSDNLADSNVQRIDVLVDAIRQVANYEYRATGILLHPADATHLKLTKDDNGQYIYPWVFINGQPTIDGVPIYTSTAMTSGTFLVGDFKRGAQIFDRRQLTIEFSNQNEDNFIKGMVTVRGHERIALAVYRPHAFIYGTFAAALAQGSA